MAFVETGRPGEGPEGQRNWPLSMTADEKGPHSYCEEGARGIPRGGRATKDREAVDSDKNENTVFQREEESAAEQGGEGEWGSSKEDGIFLHADGNGTMGHAGTPLEETRQ